MTLPRQRTVAFTYKTVVPSAGQSTDVWVPIPHDSPFQRITGLTIDAPMPYRIDTGTFGNRMLHIRVPPTVDSGRALTVRFTAQRMEHIQPTTQQPGHEVISPAERSQWLKPDRLVPIDGKVKQWANEVVTQAHARTDLDKARAIYNHVINTVHYDKTGTGWGRGDIYYACDARRGNCTDFHAIFIGYCRAVNIPARFAIGVSLPTDRPTGQISGYHCWAEFYLNGVGWVPIDASEAAKNPARRDYFFGTHDENRIEFSVGRDLKLYPEQAEPLNFFVYPYAEVAGQPVTGVKSEFTYQAL
jgi:transglutaminase-like putative cysteine protease